MKPGNHWRPSFRTDFRIGMHASRHTSGYAACGHMNSAWAYLYDPWFLSYVSLAVPSPPWPAWTAPCLGDVWCSRWRWLQSTTRPPRRLWPLPRTLTRSPSPPEGMSMWTGSWIADSGCCWRSHWLPCREIPTIQWVIGWCYVGVLRAMCSVCWYCPWVFSGVMSIWMLTGVVPMRGKSWMADESLTKDQRIV